jgi:hypothetical protein
MRRSPILLAVVVLLLTGASSCSSSESSSDSGSELPADVAQVVEDYINALTAPDVDAWRATITDDFVNRRGVYSPGTQIRWERDSYEEAADGYAFRIEFYGCCLEYEQLGDPFVTGAGPWYVTIRQRWIAPPEPDRIVWEGNVTYVVVERDGVMKVAAEYFVGTMGLLEG